MRKIFLMLVFGADPTEGHTVLGGHIIQAHLQGAKLAVVDPRVAKLANNYLQLKLGSNIAADQCHVACHHQ